MRDQAIKDLVGYAHRTGLIEECERVWAENTLLHAMGLAAWEEPQAARERPLEDILRANLEKLERRYPDGFSTEKSVGREKSDI